MWQQNLQKIIDWVNIGLCNNWVKHSFPSEYSEDADCSSLQLAANKYDIILMHVLYCKKKKSKLSKNIH